MSQNSTSPPGVEEDLWSRWGWMFGAIWLGFWAFPLYSTWSSDRSLIVQVGVTGLIAAFMVVYVVTIRRSIDDVVAAEHAQARRAGLIGMAVLITITVTLSVPLQEGAMTGMPFIVGMPVFFLPWRWVWTVSLSLLGAGMVLSWTIFGLWPPAMFWGISVIVLGMSVINRLTEERQEAGHQALAQLALAEERERVARDVHDVLGHSLTLVTMKSELARRLVDTDPGRAKAELAEVQDLSRQALAEIRATVGGLRVARLADEVAAARSALAGAGIAADLPDDVSVVDPRHRIVAAWVLREATTNVVRHSSASRCVVELTSDGLTVTDDGRGTGGRKMGNGLRGMQERVEQAGGTLMVGPGPDGAGTRLEVKL